MQVHLEPEIGLPNGHGSHTFTPLFAGFDKRKRWLYLANEAGPAAGWNEIDFNPIEWTSAIGILGYGNDNTPRPLERGEWVSAFFRREFYVREADEIDDLSFDLLVDDAAEVFINGTEVLRDNLPEGAIDPSTPALTETPNDGSSYRNFAVDPTVLVEGDNLIAVGVHNNVINGDDLAFDLGLQASRPVPAGGRRTYTLTLTNPAGSSSAQLTILFEGRVALAEWTLAHGLVGDPASTDTDLDGLSDLVEFATGSDPLSASPQPLLVEFGEDGTLIISFPSDLRADDVKLDLETSIDLKTWSNPRLVSPLLPFSFLGAVAPEDSSIAENTYRLHLSGSPGEKRYLRLRASVGAR